jgi:hypothetical protein
MPDDNQGGGGPPSTDDMLNALAKQMGVEGEESGGPPPLPEEAKAASAEEPPPEPAAEPVADAAVVAEALAAQAEAAAQAAAVAAEAAQTALAAAERARADAAAKAEAAKAPVEEAPAAEEAGAISAGSATAMLGLGGSSDDDDDDLGEPSLEDEDLDEEDLLVKQRAARNSVLLWGGLLAAILIPVLLVLMSLYSKRAEQLEGADVLVDAWWEVLTLYDVHEEDIKSWALRAHTKAERAKMPVWGHLRIESEPQQADIFVGCEPRDERCNNSGTKENPSWDPHWVRDIELKDRRCMQDSDCRECRDLTEEDRKQEDYIANPSEYMKRLCRVFDVKCKTGGCYLPLRTGATMQSLYLGTVGGLQKDRRYAVRVGMPGWISETHTVSSNDWTSRLDPSRDDSDRTFLKRFELKPDPNAPPDVKARVDAYLKKKLEDQAAMMQEMDQWEKGQ